MSIVKDYRVVLAFGFVGLVWGSNFVFMKLAAELITPMQIVLLRVLFGFVPIAAFAYFKKALSFEHIRHFHHFLTMGLLATVIYYFALPRVPHCYHLVLQVRSVVQFHFSPFSQPRCS